MGKSLIIFFSFLSIAGDLFILNFLFFLFCLNGSLSSIDSYWLWILILMNIIWVILVLVLEINTLPRIKQRKKIAGNVFLAWLILFFFFLLANFLFRKEVVFSTGFIKFLVLALISVITWKLLLDTLAHFFRKYGFNPRNVLIIGYNDKAEELKDYFIKNLWSGYHFRGFIHDKKVPITDIVGNYEDLPGIVSNQNIDELFLNLSEVPVNFRSSIMDMAYDFHLGIKLIPDLGDFPSYYHSYERFDLMPVISISKGPFSDSVNIVLKRLFDLLFSMIIILLLLTWLIPLVALIIKFTSKGPVFFRQKRTGYHNKTFTCLKFRTMIKNLNADWVQASENDSRMTGFGKFLRKTSLDELPQFFNIVAGQMSIVGPRPHMLHHTEEYSSQIPHYLQRHYFRPGITGLAQIRGYRGETKELYLMKTRIEHDIFYIENWSLWLDLKIIFITIANIFKGIKNVY